MLFAGAGFSLDQHGGIERCHPPNETQRL